MKPLEPLTGTGYVPTLRASHKPGGGPPPEEPVDSAHIGANQGLDLKKAAKIVTFESENLPEAVTLWKFDTSHYSSRAYISAGGHFYEGGLDGTLRRFASDGSILWEIRAGHNDLSVTPAVAPDGTVYVSRVVSLEAYNPDGTKRWDLPLPSQKGMDRNSLQLELAVGPEGNAYIHDSAKLYAVDPRGKVRWKKDMETWSNTRPAVSPDGKVYTVDKQDVVHCFDNTGKALWKNTDLKQEDPFLSDFSTDPEVGPDGTVYLGKKNSAWNTQDCALVAIDNKGKEKWRLPTDSELDTYETPSVDQKTGTVYLGSGRKGEEVWAVDPDGKMLWKQQVGSILHVTAMPDGKGVVVGIKGGDLHAFDEEGKPLWTFHTGDIFTKPSFGPDGVLYVGSRQTLYAIESRDKFLAQKVEERRKELMEAPESPAPPEITEEDSWIIIGGVKLPIKNTNP